MLHLKGTIPQGFSSTSRNKAGLAESGFGSFALARAVATSGKRMYHATAHFMRQYVRHQRKKQHENPINFLFNIFCK